MIAVFRMRKRKFLGLPDPNLDHSTNKQEILEKPCFQLFCDFLVTCYLVKFPAKRIRGIWVLLEAFFAFFF
jgi:hypothetical protein